MPALADWGSRLLYVLEITCGIGCIILIHELGHFVMAKLHKVRVDRFSIGIGPVLFSWRKGFGLRRGSSLKEYEDIRRAEKEGINRRDPHAMGETEYCLSLIVPLGGYVRMAGESPFEKSGDPNELAAKPPGVRLQIFVAGALMNLLLTFPICIAMYLAGMVEMLPVVQIDPAAIDSPSAEWCSDLQKGDILLSVDGKPIRSIQEYREIAILSDPKTVLHLKVLRPAPGALPRWDRWIGVSSDGGTRSLAEVVPGGPMVVHGATDALPLSVDGAKEVSLDVVTAGSEGYGLSAYLFPVIGHVVKGSAADAAGLKEGEMILEMEGQPVRGFYQLQEKVKDSPGKELTLRVRSTQGAEREVKITPKPQDPAYTLDIEEVVAPVVGAVKGGSPAKAAGFEPGDVFLSVDGTQVATWADVVNAIRKLPGKTVKVKVSRGGKEVELEPTIGTEPEMGYGAIGVAPNFGVAVGGVPAGTPWHEAHFEPRDVIRRVQGKSGANLVTLSNTAVLGKSGDPIEVVVERGGKEVTLSIKPAQKVIGLLGIEPLAIEIKKQYPLGQAISTGLGDGVKFIEMTLLMFRKLILGHESAKGLAGPVGIVTASYKMAEEGFGKLLWFFGLITVSLGIFNLLPVPILDGWYVFLLIIEKLRGKALSEQAFYRTQVVGLVMIGTLILFVTYNDISRLFHR